jgi:multisubunit Na+/H+ antiporter MnhC subunit
MNETAQHWLGMLCVSGAMALTIMAAGVTAGVEWPRGLVAVVGFSVFAPMLILAIDAYESPIP